MVQLPMLMMHEFVAEKLNNHYNLLPPFKIESPMQKPLLYRFLDKHTLPLTMAPQVIRLAQELARDHKTLQSLSMDSTTASYKLREGLGETICEKIVQDLQQVFFSMNVNECMSNAYEKIFSIIVSYFSDKLKRVVVHHYNSKALVTVNAATLFGHIKSTFDGDRIPMKNMVSNLSDSTKYMREVIWIRKKALQWSASPIRHRWWYIPSCS